jgi:hypothetical protein
MRRLAIVVVTASLLALFGGSGRHALAQDSIKGQVQSVNGMQMYYEVRGAGPPLVLLHGFFGCGQFWQPVLQQLSKHYRPDLRGHGRSTNPSGEFHAPPIGARRLRATRSPGHQTLQGDGV